MTDEAYMQRALELARLGEGAVNPNPIVGAVVVKDGVVVGEGYHAVFGGPHGEAAALEAAGEAAGGATLYVSLEPCNHHGKTPPCTDRVLASGITRIVVATRDPNPRVAGGGIERLREAGLEVVTGVLEPEAIRANEIYLHFVRTARPFVTLKLAVSLDGRIATRDRDSQWLTGEASRTEVHRLRRRNAAVLVGVGTVLDDDPRLTVRHVKGKNPLRVVLDRSGELPLTAAVLDGTARTILVVSTIDPQREEAIRARGAEVWRLPAETGQVDLDRLMERLASREIDSVLLEGGGETAASFLEAGWVNKVHWFIAPLLLGGRNAVPAIAGEGAASVAEGIRLVDTDVRRIGEDILVTGYVGRRFR